jgi:hypothetical protein
LLAAAVASAVPFHIANAHLGEVAMVGLVPVGATRGTPVGDAWRRVLASGRVPAEMPLKGATRCRPTP